MALLLRRGDPLPALHLAAGLLDVRAHAGHFWAVATAPHAVLRDLATGELPVLTSADLTVAQRLGADVHDGVPQPLLVLLDPAGTVVQSWADEPLPTLLRHAEAKARQFAGN